MRTIFIQFCLIIMLLPSITEASSMGAVIKMISQIYGINLDLENVNENELLQLKDINESLRGKHDFGKLFGNEEILNLGENAGSYHNLLDLYKNNNSLDKLTVLEQNHQNEFPIATNLESKNTIENKYYLLKSQTSLTSRASSELAFDQINHEAKLITDLQKEIDKSKDIKSSVDLNNRLVIEQNKLSIEQAKLIALLVQQQSVDSQSQSNRAREDIDFYK